jgi:hypothetical protein
MYFGLLVQYKPNTLCAKVLYGKYYHGSDFMSVRRKRNALHTWNAILHGREALRKGLIKRVGKIHIWDDPWIHMQATQ